MSNNNPRPLTELEKESVIILRSNLNRLEPLVEDYHNVLRALRETCSHPNLLKRALGEALSLMMVIPVVCSVTLLASRSCHNERT